MEEYFERIEGLNRALEICIDFRKHHSTPGELNGISNAVDALKRTLKAERKKQEVQKTLGVEELNQLFRLTGEN